MGPTFTTDRCKGYTHALVVELVDKEALQLMPSGKVRNYVFKGTKNLEFEDKSDRWISNKKGVSGATALGDLDNDGDIDLVVSNINEEVSLYVNQTNDKSNYLRLKFDYPLPNAFGIGTKVYSYHQGEFYGTHERHCHRSDVASRSGRTKRPRVEDAHGQL